MRMPGLVLAAVVLPPDPRLTPVLRVANLRRHL
jgi:hypothetical protein